MDAVRSAVVSVGRTVRSAVVSVSRIVRSAVSGSPFGLAP